MSMGKRATLRFTVAKRPITTAITKFGGQPVWLSGPQWPMSRSTGLPMRFICQVVIPEHVLAGDTPKIAYIFMTDGDEYVDGTWEPNGGENAVVIQPDTGCEAPIVDVKPLGYGPTIQRYEKRLFSKKLKPVDVELEVDVHWEEEPDFVSGEDRAKFSDQDNEAYWNAVQGSKIGGAPAFIQYDEYPDSDSDWELLLQIDSCDIPFFLNLGDAGVAYVYVDEGAKRGRMLWQCS